MSTSLYQSYLFAYVFWVCLTLGCLGLMLLHHTLRASWGRAVLRLLEAGAKTLPLMAVLLLPIVLGGLPHLYPWAQPGLVAKSHVLEHRAPYLNSTFLAVRLAIYFAVWAVLALVLTRSSLRQDRTGDQSEADRRANIAAPGIVAFVITVTFAFIDLVMSLEAEWHSTIFGVWFLSGQMLAATALVTLIVMGASSRSPLRAVVTPQLTRDLGNLLLAFTMFWAYISVSQYLIIWSGNLPEEITYYISRSKPGWGALASVVIIGQFVAPFIALLANRTKRTPSMLRALAWWIIAMRVLDVYWIVMPSMRTEGLQLAVGDVAAFALMGVAWIAAFAVALRSAPLLARHEPSTQEELSHAHA